MRTALLLLLLLASSARAEEVDVSAAASLQDLLHKVQPSYETRFKDRVLFNFGGSSTLAMQIRAGAPADVFISADADTMDSLGDLIQPSTRRLFASNVLVVLSNRPIRTASDLRGLSKIAIANPATAPAGAYARRWLQRIGLWNDLQSHLVPTADVRAALAAVDAGNVDAAIVYKTDASVARYAKVAFEVTGADAPQIAYEIGIPRDARHPAAARRMWTFLQSPEARKALAEAGFWVPISAVARH